MRATIYTYPWDLTDEGIDSALDTIAHTAGLNSVSLAQSYHVSTYFLPHNPRRPLYWGEEGALYFHPSAAFYEESHIAPLISNVVDEPDYMRRIADKVKERGLDLTSWLVFNYNHYLPQHYPDAAKHDPFGHSNFAQLCPASPLVRDYGSRALPRYSRAVPAGRVPPRIAGLPALQLRIPQSQSRRKNHALLRTADGIVLLSALLAACRCPRLRRRELPAQMSPNTSPANSPPSLPQKTCSLPAPNSSPPPFPAACRPFSTPASKRRPR